MRSSICHYPTDIKLLNEAREQTEIAIDALYKQVKEQLPKKPRTYRREARTEYLQIAKQRKPNRKKIRKALRKQLAHVRRNLAHIDSLIAAGAMLSELKGTGQLNRDRRICVFYIRMKWTFQNPSRIS